VYIKILLPLLFCGYNAASQSAKTIYGTVANSKQEPISLVSVGIYNAKDSALTAFTFSNAQGQYSITFTPLPIAYYLRATHISFSTFFTAIDVSKAVHDSLQLNVKIVERGKTLENVVINSSMGPGGKYKDTLTLAAADLKTADVTKVQDLLAKVPGLAIDGNGNISVKGIPIEKILIDGADITGQNYGVISRNLSANIIDSVQLIGNYEENRLKRNHQRNEKIAINLITQNGDKSKISGSLSAAGSMQKRYSLESNLVGLMPKLKFITIANKNNVSDLRVDVSESASKYFDNSNSASFINPSNVFAPQVGGLYTVNNKDANVGAYTNFKVNKAITILSEISYSKANLYQLANTSTAYKVENDLQFTIDNTRNSTSSKGLPHGSITVNHDYGRNNVGGLSITYQKPQWDNRYTEIASGAFVDTQQEKVNMKGTMLNISGFETIKNAKNKVLNINYGLSDVHNPITFNIATTRLDAYYAIGALNRISQLSNQHRQMAFLTPEWLIKWRKIPLRISATSLILQSKDKYKQIVYTTDRSVDLLSVPTNYKEIRQTISLSGSTRLGRKSFISFDAFTGCSWQQLQIANKAKKFRHVGGGAIKVNREISFMRAITLDYSIKNIPPTISSYFPAAALSSGISIYTGSPQLLTNRTMQNLKLAYSRVNMIKASKTSLLASFSLNDGIAGQAPFYFTEYTLYDIVPLGSSSAWQLMGSYNKFVLPLRTKFEITASYTSNHKISLINNQLFKNTFSQASIKTTFATGFDGYINFEGGLTWASNRNGIKKDGSRFNKFSANRLEYYTKTKFSLKKNLAANLLFASYQLNPQSVFNSLDAYFFYKLNNTWSFSTVFHNMLNEKTVSEKTITDVQNSIARYGIIGQYFLVKINFDF